MRSTSRFASNPESAPSGTSLSASSTICGPIASAPKSALASTFATTIAEGGSSASGSASRSTFGGAATAAGLAPPHEATKARAASGIQRSMRPEASTGGYGAGYDPSTLKYRVMRLISSNAITSERSVKCPPIST